MSGKMVKVSTNELRKRLDHYLSRVRSGAEKVVVVENDLPVAELRGLPGATCTLRDFVEIWNSYPPDEALADDLEKVNAADRPLDNPWD